MPPGHDKISLTAFACSVVSKKAVKHMHQQQKRHTESSLLSLLASASNCSRFFSDGSQMWSLNNKDP